MAYIELCGMKKSEAGQFFRRQLIETEDKYRTTEEYRNKYNNTDFYRSIFEYSTSDLETALIRGPLFLDLDTDHLNQNTFQDIRRTVNFVSNKLLDEFCISREYQELFFSGSKGFHIIVQPKIFGADYSQDIVSQYKRVAQWLAELCQAQFDTMIDLRIYDRRRVLRVVNSKNSKSGLYKIPLRFSELTTYEDLIKKAKSPRPYTPRIFGFYRPAWERWTEFCNNVTTDNIRGRKKENTREEDEQRRKEYSRCNLLPCVKKLLRTSVSQGNRNNVTVALASFLFQAGFNSDEIFDKVRDWNENNNPPLPDNELLHTIMSANHMGSQDKKYGCAAMKEFRYCEPRYCRILLNRSNPR